MYTKAHLTHVLQNNDTACVAIEATTCFGPPGSSLGTCVKTPKRRYIRNYKKKDEKNMKKEDEKEEQEKEEKKTKKKEGEKEEEKGG